MVLHDWEILERKSKTSENRVFLVYRVIHVRGRVPETEFLYNSGEPTRALRRRPSTFRTRTAAEKAIAALAARKEK